MNTFNEQGLSPEILKAIGEMGFVTPTPIQEKTIPAILNTTDDIIALAQTGTGKTAGFGLPIIQQIDDTNRAVQSLILCPTRELCLQIASDLNKFSKYQKNLSVLAVYGGSSITNQIHDLRNGAQIVVGTPGRTLDLINRKALKVQHIQWLVLDEADEMLNMGFKEELDSILATTPAEKRTLLFSATMPAGVRHIAGNYMQNPLEISVGTKNAGADNVEHEYYVVKAPDRYLALKRIADIHPEIYGIVFCRTRHETKEVADKLIQDGYNADALHGDLSQAQRDSVMQRFRQKNLQLLIATDVAARGLDVNDLTHVINYNLPDDLEVYIHRSGRTGRAGKSGISITIVHSRETRKIQDLERMSKKKFQYRPVPKGREICEKRLFSMVDKFEQVVIDESQIESFLPAVLKKLESIDKEELIKRFVSLEFNQFLEYYKNAPDLNVNSERSDSTQRSGKRTRMESSSERPNERFNDRSNDRPRRGNQQFSRFYINLGTKNELNASQLIGLINDHTRNREIEIGKIDILRKFSFFEVDKSFEKQVLNSFDRAMYKGEELVIQLSSPVQQSARQSFESARPNDYVRKDRKREFSDKNVGKRRAPSKRY